MPVHVTCLQPQQLLNIDARTERVAQRLLSRVRAISKTVTGVMVGGQEAQSRDFVSAVYGSFPLMFSLIALITFILLARAFRSLLLPLKAILLNLLSLAAAWGVLVLIWQQGHGSQLLYGIAATGA